MSSGYYSYPAYHAGGSAPIAMPHKRHGTEAYYPPQQTGHHGRLSVSPPEPADSVTTGGPTSYDPTATGSSSYAGSASDYEMGGRESAASVDLMDYMGDRLNGAFDSTPLDRSLAKQAQTSGELNAKTRELMQLQALARERLAATQRNFSDGMKAAKEVQRDLEWTQKRVSSINQRAARKYPDQYKRASERYPAPVDY
ncbi:putative biogenesis of lysosome-related organelles complex 1 subunit kxd1 [Diplodia seriata]|uniref:Biogenesis of lysosome-related organelles complex 1 subunit KXD1 n=3 Tax=Diplodia TaxID=66735 RepID=A0A0G2EWJ5_9PEZI|nr:putative biogenesis of lysosome-related organelles complex 1 subunit kxd1 [Diplodia seriata]OMP81587.1 Biogenesis of lysosome-related organelles complex 1 subunit KXD1 [Diplodia seriata]